MKGKLLFSLCCCVVSLWFWAGSQPAYASPTVNWSVAPMPPPTSTPEPDPTAPITATLDQPFALRIGQWATISDTPEAIGVQIYGLVSDNRCPEGVDCIVAGQAEFIVIVRTGTEINQERFQLSSVPVNGENQLQFAGYVIELTGVEPPAPPPDQTLLPSDYVATFVVSADPNANPTPAPTTAATATPVAQQDPGEAQAVALNQPFSLLIGETAMVREADFQLTLRSLSDDSGCLSQRDCSTMLADGTLILVQGDDREVLQFSTSLTPDQSFDYEFGSYVVQLTHVEQARDGELVATFVIQGAGTTNVIPTPETIERCPAFSRFDATAILQEDVAETAIANLVFGPIAADAQAIRGLCGYVNTTLTTDQPRDEQTAYLASALDADHAVVAARLEGADVLQLLSLANLIRAANSDVDADDFLRIQTQLSAGDYEDVLDDLEDLAEDVPTITVENIEGIGDDGRWLWQELPAGYLAMFISRDEDAFDVVMALLGEEVEELTVLDYMVIIARRLAEDRAVQQPTNDEPVAGCDLLSVADASAIFGESVHQPVFVDTQGGVCLYIPSSEPALTADEAADRGPEYGIVTSEVDQADVTEQVYSLVEELLFDNPDADDETLALLEDSLTAGDTVTALQFIPELAAGLDQWQVEEMTELREGAIWIWYDDDEQSYSVLMVPNTNGSINTIIASYRDAPDTNDVRAAMLTAAAQWSE